MCRLITVTTLFVVLACIAMYGKPCQAESPPLSMGIYAPFLHRVTLREASLDGEILHSGACFSGIPTLSLPLVLWPMVGR